QPVGGTRNAAVVHIANDHDLAAGVSQKGIHVGGGDTTATDQPDAHPVTGSGGAGACRRGCRREKGTSTDCHPCSLKINLDLIVSFEPPVSSAEGAFAAGL